MILWFTRNALAVTWWVAAPEEAERVRAALDASWPGHTIDVEVGPPGVGDVVWVRQGTVLARLGGDEHQQAAPTLELQVVLVRSWARHLVVEDAGWIPDLPDPPRSPTPEPEPPPEGPRWMGTASLGGGLRFTQGDGLAIGALEAGIRSIGVGGIVRIEGLASDLVDEAEFGYRTRSGAVSFGFVGLPLGAPKLSWSASVGVRVNEHRTVWASPAANVIARSTTTQPTGRASVRWTEPLGSLRVGMAVALSVDAPLQLSSPDLRDADWPVLAAAELVVERR